MRRACGRAAPGALSALPCACAFVYTLLLCSAYASIAQGAQRSVGAGAYQGTLRHLAQQNNSAEQLDEAILQPGQVVQYVVVFAASVTGAAAAAGALVQQVQESMAAAAAGAAAAAQQQQQQQISQGVPAPPAQAAGATYDIRVLRMLGSSRAPDAQSSAEAPDSVAASSASAAAAAGAAGVQAAVVAAPAAALQHIRQLPHVRAVFRDRVIRSQGRVLSSSSSSSSMCVDEAQLQAGLSSEANLRLHWPGCHTHTAKLVWSGSTCSRNAADVPSQHTTEAGTGADADVTAQAAGSVAYSAVKAVDASTGEQLMGTDGAPCVMTAQDLSRGRSRQWFGSCGKAPRFAPGLPAVLCDGGSSSSSSGSSQPGADAADATLAPGQIPDSVQQQQQQQQPSDQPQPTDQLQLTAAGEQQAVADQQQQQQQQQGEADAAADTNYDQQHDYTNPPLPPPSQDGSSAKSAFDKPATGFVTYTAGGTTTPTTTTNPSAPGPTPGVPGRRRRRFNVQPAPPPLPSEGPVVNDIPGVPAATGLLPREALAPGETVPTGVGYIGGATARALPVTGGPAISKKQQVTVAICDSGVDMTHPDIEYVGGKTWVRRPSKNAPGDMVDAGVDFFGHGTHVAGIVGACNNGAGVVGVAPCVPIYSLKVLDGDGTGALSDALDAVKWASGPEGQALNIKVINLSIATYVSTQADDYKDTIQVVCQILQEASDAGVLVVAAAGNYQGSLLNYVPAACPAVAAVTSLDIDSRAPSMYSNFLPADASDVHKTRVMAAPGNSVLSTMSVQKDKSLYRELSGTSQAAPHVAGIVAICIEAGACPGKSTGLQKLAIVRAAARERLAQQGRYGYDGDPTSENSGSRKYYGYLAWSKFWQR